MRGLGRLVALPFLLVALALQGLAPAQASAMPRDAFGSPICSAHYGGGGHQPMPQRGPPHDCCAAACALAGLGAAPPAHAFFTPTRFATPLVRPTAVLADGRILRRLDRPHARGPPFSILEA
jgi:hypothetical protein